MHTALRPALAIGLAAIAAAGTGGVAAAQTPPTFPYLATLTADDLVRAGADVRFYPFGRVETGDVVRVVGEKAGWARVVTLGPAFKDFYGFVRVPASGTASFRLSLDGASGTTNAPTDVLAPNLDAEMKPASSWKPATTLPAGRTLRVIATDTADADVIYKVALPDDAEGWIDLTHLRPATVAETDAWEAAIRQPVEVAAQTPAATDDVKPVQQTPVGHAQLNAAATIDAGATAVAPPAAAPTTQAPTPRAAPPAHRRSRLMLDDLEAAYMLLLKEPIESAEVGPLRLLYIDLAERAKDSRAISRFARTRAQQLALWAEAQQRRTELDEAIDRAKETTKKAEAARQVMAAMDRYAAVGRLDASTIYDGKRLPKLLRVRDDRGRTLAYIEPDDRFDYANLLGYRVGVVGTLTDDGGLRVTLVEPTRIDVLGAPAAPAAADDAGPQSTEQPE